jgi:hypothetical protein
MKSTKKTASEPVRDIQLKSIADRFEELAQAEPCKDKFTLPSVWVQVDLYDTTKDSTEFLQFYGDAQISFSDKLHGGYIASVILEDRRQGKVFSFEDWDIRHKCIQNKERSILGAFVMPRIVTITDGKFHARAQYFFPPQDGGEATADCWENGSVDNCKIIEGASGATHDGDRPKLVKIEEQESGKTLITIGGTLNYTFTRKKCIDVVKSLQDGKWHKMQRPTSLFLNDSTSTTRIKKDQLGKATKESLIVQGDYSKFSKNHLTSDKKGNWRIVLRK